ncbi:MAG: alpha/beta fold hydrolase, partial [Flavobacteriales bacterium]|nr:alpha/beta fold hydrolase [Flavobacteriales bacterium]
MNLNYKAFGEGEPLIILHGLLGMLDNWQGPAKLMQYKFLIYIVDLRNHGHSQNSDEHNYDLMSADVIQLMDTLKIERAHLLGHSMGGKVAMKIAEEHSERVNKLVVADIGPKEYPVHHEQIIAGLKSVPLDELERRSDAEPYLEKYIPEPGVRQFLMKSLFHPDRGSFDWRFNLEAIERNLHEVGQSVDELGFDGETLFIRGGSSNYVLDEDWADIKTLYPNAYLETIDDAGHWLHAEKPQEFV